MFEPRPWRRVVAKRRSPVGFVGAREGGRRHAGLQRAGRLGLSVAMVVAVTLVVTEQAAHGHGSVDQQSLVGGNNLGSTTLDGQSFLPLVDNITGLDFAINATGGATAPFNLTVEVRVRLPSAPGSSTTSGSSTTEGASSITTGTSSRAPTRIQMGHP
jgi:hypothetical protein